MPAHRVGPPVQLESVKQYERPCLANALQNAEDAADVHHRGVDDRDPTAAVRSEAVTVAVRGPITLRASMS